MKKFENKQQFNTWYSEKSVEMFHQFLADHPEINEVDAMMDHSDEYGFQSMTTNEFIEYAAQNGYDITDTPFIDIA